MTETINWTEMRRLPDTWTTPEYELHFVEAKHTDGKWSYQERSTYDTGWHEVPTSPRLELIARQARAVLRQEAPTREFEVRGTGEGPSAELWLGRRGEKAERAPAWMLLAMVKLGECTRAPA